MPYPNKLKGKEQEIYARRKAGETEYRLAIEYNVYPFAIRRAVARIEAKRDAERIAAGK